MKVRPFLFTLSNSGFRIVLGGDLVLVYSKDDLINSEVKLIKYISNERLEKLLSDKTKVTFFMNFSKIEILLFTLPVFLNKTFVFKRVILIVEKKGSDSFLVYDNELLENKSFRSFINGINKVKDPQFSLLDTCVKVYFDCVNYIDDKCKKIEESVIDEKYVSRNIISLMTFNTVLQQARPNVEGIKTMIDELISKMRSSGDGSSLDDSLLMIKLEIVQVDGLLNGVSEVIDNVSDSIDSINNFRLNVVMRTLTIVTLCLAIPTLAAGIYGMNVPLPFADKGWILYVVLGSCLLFISFLIVFFKRKRYF